MLNWLNDRATLVQVFASIVALVFSSIAVFQTSVSLNRQDSSQHLEYRAYVVVRQSISTDQVVTDDTHVYIPFMFENKGLTSANDIKVEAFIETSVDQKKEYITSNKDQLMYLARGDSYKIQIGIPKSMTKLVPLLTRNSGNFFVIEITYRDYRNQKYLLRAKYVIQPPDIYNLAIYDIGEEIIN